MGAIKKLETDFAGPALQNKDLMGCLSRLQADHALLSQSYQKSQAENDQLRQLILEPQEDRHSFPSAPHNSVIKVASIATQTPHELPLNKLIQTLDGQNAGTQTTPQFNATSTGSQIKQQSFFRPAASEGFKLFGASTDEPVSESLNTQDEIIKSINFKEQEVSKEDSGKFLQESGHTVYTNQGQSYKFHYDPHNPPAKAQLFKDQLPGEDDSNRELKIALAVMNMIENVLAKGEELHVYTKDPFIAAIANLYIKKIKVIEINGTNPFSETVTSVSSESGDDSTAARIFDSIMQSPAYKGLMKDPANVPWIKEFKAERAATPEIRTRM